MPYIPDVAGYAASAIREALLFALSDCDISPDKEIVGVLQDAVAAHANDDDGRVDLHHAAAALINGILAGGDSARRRQAPP